VIARLVPVGRAPARRRTAAAWSTLDRVAREIGARWPAASTLGLPLVTWDVEQRQRAARVIDVVSPENRR
jgi:hypothetical protein